MTIEEIYSRYLECGCLVTTDSRTIKGGEMFIALKGENFDGNEYVPKALESGAKYAIADREGKAAGSGDSRVILVDDTFVLLKHLANYHRHHCLGERHLPVIGLTGTNGKTTTKELIRSVLSKKYNVTATEGNLNNDIGVPLSLLKIKPETELAVIEMGANHPDDIKHLVEVCEPDLGLITTVGKAHLLGFGSFEGVKKAKGQLYDFISDRCGEVFLNVDDGVVFIRVCSVSEDFPCLVGAFDRECVKTEGLEADNGLLTAYNADLIHMSHAPFPVSCHQKNRSLFQRI